MYTDYFGFREKPFGVTPDPRFFYTNPCYQEAYASLFYGIHERRGFIVLTGEVGTGKTTLLRRLMEHMESNVKSVFFFHTTLTFEELLDFTCEELQLPIKEDGKLHKIRVLNQLLMDQMAKSGTVALLIDEAQNLGTEVLENLRLLSNLETTAEKLLQIVLVGQPELEAKLALPELRQVKQRVAIQCRLERLDDEEVGPFIDYRLKFVGYRGRPLFTPDAVQAIAYHSKGFPRLINILCDNALLIAYATSQKRVTGQIIKESASDLGFELPQEGPRATGESRQVPRGVRLKQGEAAVVPGRDDGQKQTFSHSRKKLPITVAALFLSLAGVGFYMSQINTSLVEGVHQKLGTWQKILQGRLGEEMQSPKPRTSLEHGDQIASIDKRTAASTGKVGPASEAHLSGMEASQESRDSRTPPERTMTGGGDKVSTTARVGHEEVGSIGSLSGAAARREKPMSVPSGTTIAEIAANTYGSQKDLGLDLIKEYNSQIENLNRVRAGEILWLPPLSQETLVRQRPDGSYSLILASFRTSQQAEQLAQLARLKSYDVSVRARPVSQNLVLHRVEINGLANRDAVDQAWETASTNRWIGFAGRRSGKRF